MSAIISSGALRRRSFFTAYKELLKLGVPVLLAQLGNIIVGQADTMMVGAYGTNELAAAAFVNNILLVPFVMIMGFAAGVTPLVGALFGAGKPGDVGRMLRVGLQLNLGLSTLMVLAMGVMYFFLDRMGQDPVLLPLIRPYYLIVLGSMFIGGIFFPCMQMCNGVTDTATPMWIIIGTNVLNITGNYLLIFGKFGAPEWGLTGAGLSTLFARVMSVVVFISVILMAGRYRPYRTGLLQGRGLGPMRRKLFATSWPVMVQSGVETLLWSVGAVMCGWFSKQQLAGYQVVVSISQLGFMTYMSFCTAVSIRVANYAGTRDIDGMRRVTLAGLHLSLMLATGASLLFLVAGDSLLHMFTPDPLVIHVGEALILPLIIYQYADAIQMLYANALRGTGHVMPLVWISFICYVLLGIGSMYLLAKEAGLMSKGVFYSFCVALFVAAWLMRRAFMKELGVEQLAKKQVKNSDY